MTRERFGESGRGDPAARQERIISEAAAAQIRFIEEEAPQVLNRPLGSRHISSAEQLQDYLAVRDDQAGALARLDEVIGQYGEQKGWLRFVEWAEQMEGRYNAEFRAAVIEGEPPVEVT